MIELLYDYISVIWPNFEGPGEVKKTIVAVKNMWVHLLKFK